MISTRRDKMSDIKFTDEKILKPRKGIPMLIFLIIAAILSFALIIVSAALFIDEYNNLVVGIPLMVVAIMAFITCCISFGGLKEVNPNEASSSPFSENTTEPSMITASGSSIPSSQPSIPRPRLLKQRA